MPALRQSEQHATSVLEPLRASCIILNAVQDIRVLKA